ncbi:MAG: hypothetical protein Q8M29_04645 [Bacteroidota bacterium]|nr:hypothetical protein [Bacteroidota bacterium]
MSNIQILNPKITIGKADDSIGMITYNGDIGINEPQIIKIGSNEGVNSLFVVFQNDEEFYLGELTDEQYELAQTLEYEIRKGSTEVMIGFYRIGKSEEEILQPCYKVPIEIDTKITEIITNKITSKVHWFCGNVKEGSDSSKGFRLVDKKGNEKYFPINYANFSYNSNDELSVLWSKKKISDKLTTLYLVTINKSTSKKVFDNENLEEVLFPRPGCIFALIVLCLSILFWIYNKEFVAWLNIRFGLSATLTYCLIVVLGGIGYWIWARLIPRVKAKYNVEKFMKEFNPDNYS